MLGRAVSCQRACSKTAWFLQYAVCLIIVSPQLHIERATVISLKELRKANASKKGR